MTLYQYRSAVKHYRNGEMALTPKMLQGAQIREELRTRFVELCDRLGWRGPTAIARELHAQQSNVSGWLDGTRPIPPHYLQAIAEKAGETRAFFAPREDPEAVRRRDLLVAAREMELHAAALRREALGEAATPPLSESPEGPTRADPSQSDARAARATLDEETGPKGDETTTEDEPTPREPPTDPGSEHDEPGQRPA